MGSQNGGDILTIVFRNTKGEQVDEVADDESIIDMLRWRFLKDI